MIKRVGARARHWPRVAVALAALSGCSDAETGSPANGGTDAATSDAQTSYADAGPKSNNSCAAGEFASTFEAIQQVIFEGGNCTNSKCHGDAVAGGLDLRKDVAYKNLIEVKSTLNARFRVMPGVPDESFLYNKLRAATEPNSVVVEGSSMPSAAPPLSPEHLEVLRRWIEVGAPREGSIGDPITGKSDAIAELLGSCLPAVTPIEIKSLEPPAATEGIQVTLAPFTLPGGKEVDVCFAQYYDFSDIVPAEFQDPERGVFFVNGQRTRQDPHSHHLGIKHSGLGVEWIRDPAFGAWACRGGDSKGAPCDPLQRGACGSGQCASEPQHKAACIGYGPTLDNVTDIRTGSIATAQTAQYFRPPRQGLYETIPIRGILYMNSHAFNLTSHDTDLHAWVNLFYAKERTNPVETLAVIEAIGLAHGQPPFTKKVLCATWTAPQNSDMYNLTSHTHKRGSNFTVAMPDGTQIYKSPIYTDPIEKLFDPPIHFGSADPAQRTLTYCADYNNGVTKDGKPDLNLVTRLSTMPDRTTCNPVACVAGKIGAPCRGAADNATCDSSPGAGDGSCDACAITFGQTTENEMFVLSPAIVTH